MRQNVLMWKGGPRALCLFDSCTVTLMRDCILSLMGTVDACVGIAHHRRKYIVVVTTFASWNLTTILMTSRQKNAPEVHGH